VTASAKAAKLAQEAVDVVLTVLGGDQPLLGLAPRGQEHAAVVLEQPVAVAPAAVDGGEGP
jgi:hypothetical protein